MACGCGCSSESTCTCSYKPPPKCYICYPKPSSSKCEILDDPVMLAAMGNDRDRLQRWVDLFFDCQGRCPTATELQAFQLAYMDKEIGFCSGSNLPMNVTSGCPGGVCPMNTTP